MRRRFDEFDIDFEQEYNKTVTLISNRKVLGFISKRNTMRLIPNRNTIKTLTLILNRKVLGFISIRIFEEEYNVTHCETHCKEYNDSFHLIRTGLK